jgi:hypothetical protein
VPAGQVGRVVFGILVAIASTLLMAPQTDEFGTKVGLLAGLVVWCAARPILDRVLPEPRTAADDLGRFVRRLVTGGGDGGERGARGSRGGIPRVARVAALVATLLVVGAGIVAAGAPARGFIGREASALLDPVPHRIDPATLPAISVGQDVIDFDHTMAGPAGQQLVVTLAENLEVENQAVLRADPALLTAVDHGDRLIELQDRLRQATASGTTRIAHYRFDAISMSLLVPFGRQDGLSMGLEATGTVTEETRDASGAVVSSTTKPFANVFALRRATGGRWLLVAVLPPTPR